MCQALFSGPTLYWDLMPTNINLCKMPNFIRFHVCTLWGRGAKNFLDKEKSYSISSGTFDKNTLSKALFLCPAIKCA